MQWRERGEKGRDHEKKRREREKMRRREITVRREERWERGDGGGREERIGARRRTAKAASCN